MNPEAEIRKKKLTRFLCQELLYEFANGGLSPQREKEMREYIASCRDSQREFEKLKRGHAYAMRASGVRMSPALKEALLNFEPHWQKQLRVWTLWSSQRGWKMLPYVVLALTLITGLFVFKPWKPAEKPEVTLAEQLKVEPDMVAPPTGDQPTPMPQPEPTAPVIAPVLVAHPQPTPVTPPPDVAPTPAVPSVVVTSPTNVPSSATSAKSAEASADDKAVMPGVARGSLMRGELKVSDFPNTWPMIRDKVIALGGKVAGNVELGWLRRPDQSYFHFSLPQSNLSELELFLGTFGRVQFTKERNPRVMPEGQIRIILTVKDSITDEGSSETP